MKNILVTGAGGQLSSAIEALVSDFKNLNFVFKSSQQLDITNPESITIALDEFNYDIVVNAAAYTAVDKAETDAENAYAVNALAVKYLAEATFAKHIPLIHISTDYVFDGMDCEARLETDLTNPIGVYGESKLAGEHFAVQANPHSVIIRTAWVYSEYGNNFLKTMLRLFQEKKELGVIDDQIGSPTNANDLARTIATIASADKLVFGIFNYSNEGQCSWYDFANKIKEFVSSEVKINTISSAEYVTAAKRPAFSLLNKTKIKSTYGIEIPHWIASLQMLIERMHKAEQVKIENEKLV